MAKETTRRKKIDIGEKYDSRVCKAIHVVVEEDLENLEKNNKDVLDRIETEIGKINTKIDKIDLNLTGNNKVGIHEQIRDMKWKTRWGFRIVFCVLALLLGFRIFGTRLKDIAQEFASDEQNITVVEKEVNQLKKKEKK